MEKNRILVEFCPCGHTLYVLKSEINPQTMEEIEFGKRLSAPVKHSSECMQCDEDLRELNRRASLWDL